MFAEVIREIGPTIVYAILVALFGYLGRVAKKLAEKYLNDERKKDIATACVSFVEQVYKTLHGEEKFDRAMESLQNILNDKGIAFSEEELRVLIESAVYEFNAGFRDSAEEEKSI